jgi:hypothetical protein
MRDREEWDTRVGQLEAALRGASFWDMPNQKVARIMATRELGYGYEGYEIYLDLGDKTPVSKRL